MDHAIILEKLKQILAGRFDLDPHALSGDTRQRDMGIDSILLVDLMLDIETELNFSFNSMDVPPNPSLDELCQLIAKNMSTA